MGNDHDTQARAQQKSTRRRDKPQLSCTLCRQKKLKCDRNQPCKNCEKRPLGSCVYIHAGSKGRPVKALADDDAMRISVHDRIKRLEQLVTSLADVPMPNQQQTAVQQKLPNQTVNFKDPIGVTTGTRHRSSTSSIPERSDHLSVDETETRYLTPSHWEAILGDISEIKDALVEDQSDETDSPEEISRAQYPTILFGERRPGTVMDIICSMPPKAIVDEIMTLFVKSVDIPTFCYHVPTLLKLYDEFWEDPTSPSVSVTWLATLHVVMVMTLHFASRSGATIRGLISPQQTASILTTRVSELLILSDYTKPTKWTIDAFQGYLACEHFRTDSDFKISLAFAILFRLAIRAGYHRDPSHYPHVSVFEGEMRRRIWALILHYDLVLAFACGTPALADDSKIDTRMPGNYLDEDLDAGMTSLPPERPDAEQTWIGYINFKMRALRMLAKVVDLTSSPTSIPYEEVLALDQQVIQLFNDRPMWLRIPNAKALNNLSPAAIARLCFVDLITSRSRIVLHRRFMVPARDNKSFQYSREVCLSSAVSTLSYQNELHSVNRKPVGMEPGNWRFFTFMAHDFQLAAMIICVDLDQDLIRTGGNLKKLPISEQEAIRQRVKLLRASHKIWGEAFNSSPESRKASSVVRLMLARVEKAQAGVQDDGLKDPVKGTPTNETWHIQFPQVLENGPPMNAVPTGPGMTFDIPSDINSNPANFIATPQSSTGPSTVDGQITIDDIDLNMLDGTDGPLALDWSEWDKYLGTSSLEF